jgi:mRNA interferase RelE/StbE
LYDLIFVPGARDDLQKLDRHVAQRVLDRLRWLAANFESVTPEPLTGDWKGLFKFRVGSYRVLYAVDQADQELTVYAIGHRREVYKRR